VKICSRVAGSSSIPESRAVTTPFSSWQGELQDRLGASAVAYKRPS
jgi:hypothetical protein